MARHPQSRRKLTDQQEHFVREFLAGGRANASAAYRAAYRAGRMTDEAVRVAACRLLKNPRIDARIRQATAKAESRTQITADRVLRRLWKEGNRFKGKGAKHSARVAALKAVGQCLGMFAKKVELSGPNGQPIEATTTPPLTNDQILNRLGILCEGAADATT